MFLYTAALSHPTINFTVESFSPSLLRNGGRGTFDWNVRVDEPKWRILRAMDANDEGVPRECVSAEQLRTVADTSLQLGAASDIGGASSVRTRLRNDDGLGCARFVGKLYHALKF